MIEAERADTEAAAANFEHDAWDGASPVHLTRYWSGEEAPAGRHAEARIVWDDEALGARFICRQTEPLVTSRAAPPVGHKTMGLWDFDVCEIFLAPDAGRPEHYYEFEAAPTGEWLDVAINWRTDGRETDWQFQSGLRTAARVAEGVVTITIRIPFDALGRRPRAGERWRANLFRCVGAGPERGYLAWQPTYTGQPNFHVPQKFGWLSFRE